MQSIPVFINDYGEIVLEIDRLIKADRASLNSDSSQRTSRSPINQVSCPQATSVCQIIAPGAANREVKAKPSLWQAVPPMVAFTDSSSGSPSNRNADQRQARLFKTRFCSYGLDCPYLAKGKCLYAHNKDEIRLRPPPPCGYKVPNVKVSPNYEEKNFAPDQSPIGSNESVWSLPESQTLTASCESNSLLDCLVDSDSRAIRTSSILGSY